MALKHAAAEKARVVHNDGEDLTICGKGWTVKIFESANGGISILPLHNDSNGPGASIILPNPKV